jgi:hypothetical protein
MRRYACVDVRDSNIAERQAAGVRGQRYHPIDIATSILWAPIAVIRESRLRVAGPVCQSPGIGQMETHSAQAPERPRKPSFKVRREHLHG